MGRRKSDVVTNYPPLGMRLARAAAYLDISESSFQRLVDAGDLPPGVVKGGMVIWDRQELEAAFENWKDKRKGRASDDAAVIMGKPPG
jgi:predicted DNA-binding transcriptional regulator AlpA